MHRLLWVACGLTALAIAALLVWKPAPGSNTTPAETTAGHSTDTPPSTEPGAPAPMVDTDIEGAPPPVPAVATTPGALSVPPTPPGRPGPVPPPDLTKRRPQGSIAETPEQATARKELQAIQEQARRDWLAKRVQAPAPGKPVPEPVLTMGLGRDLNQEGAGVMDDMAVVQSVFTQFRRHYKENPVGENYEITAALVGANSKRISYLAADNAAINERGELCDRWGNPYWFHSQSKDVMEIISRGPDGELHTDDDVKMQ